MSKPTAHDRAEGYRAAAFLVGHALAAQPDVVNGITRLLAQQADLWQQEADWIQGSEVETVDLET